jgi:hypothetical protein
MDWRHEWQRRTRNGYICSVLWGDVMRISADKAKTVLSSFSTGLEFPYTAYNYRTTSATPLILNYIISPHFALTMVLTFPCPLTIALSFRLLCASAFKLVETTTEDDTASAAKAVPVGSTGIAAALVAIAEKPAINAIAEKFFEMPAVLTHMWKDCGNVNVIAWASPTSSRSRRTNNWQFCAAYWYFSLRDSRQTWVAVLVVVSPALEGM